MNPTCHLQLAANGLVITYIGHIELDVHYNGKTIPQRGSLIVKYSSDDTTRKHKEYVPGIIGMNSIGACTDILGDVRNDGNLSEVLGTSGLKQKSVCGFARVFGTVPLCIPAHTAIVIPCTGPHVKADVIVNPLSNGDHLHRNFRTVNTCDNIYNDRLWVHVANIGDEDVYLKPYLFVMLKVTIQILDLIGWETLKISSFNQVMKSTKLLNLRHSLIYQKIYSKLTVVKKKSPRSHLYSERSLLQG